MRDLVAVSLVVNFLRYLWLLLVLLYEYFITGVFDALFARGFIFGVWNSIALFFLPFLQLLVAYSLMYIFDLVVKTKESTNYLINRRTNP